MDATFEFNDNSTINTLFIKTLDRTNFGQTFTCMASNNNATLPVATNVTIDMRRKFFELFTKTYLVQSQLEKKYLHFTCT